MPWPFRLVNNLSLRGNVEGCHSVLFMSNCLLLIGKSSSRCLGLSICISGGFV